MTVLPQIVFTDLDGSLLDHHSYSYEPASPMLEELARRGIPVVPTSSKTRAEIEDIRAELGNGHPFIVENGAAVFIPVGYFPRQPADTVERDGFWIHESSEPRAHWLQLLSSLETHFAGEFDSFYRVGPEGISRMTGLSISAADLANRREYSEPVRWLGEVSRRDEFLLALSAGGANPLQGGRFLTVAGDCDKGRALAWLRKAYCQALNVNQVIDIAAGDSGNDVAMLEAAQTALVIRSPVHGYPQLSRADGIIYSAEHGPTGWALGVEQWLNATAQSANRL